MTFDDLQDKESREIYAEDFLNTFIATQIKVLREQRNLTQQQLAELTGMKQERISVMEDVNYDAWSAQTLIRLARAFDVRLTIKFESYDSLVTEHSNFSRKTLERQPFTETK